MIVFISMITLNNIIEYFKPWFRIKMKTYKENKGIHKEKRSFKSQPEKEYELTT